MTSPVRSALLAGYRASYRGAARPLIFRVPAQNAHERALNQLGWLDDHGWTHGLLSGLHGLSFEGAPCMVGGVRLPYPIMLAAGMVKGHGFDSEAEALRAAASDNIMPGWRALPLLVGPVEFGSFTRWPRMGNPGLTVWRDEPTRSTQNRVGLKNPGAAAAAAFLARHRSMLPPVFGINVAPSPGVDDLAQVADEIAASLSAFLDASVVPSWFTLNLSCPNTEDDPALRQTEQMARAVVAAAASALKRSGAPLWVKLGPALSDDQYRLLIGLLADGGARAIVACNTLPRPAPSDARLVAGAGGGLLHDPALAAVRMLAAEKSRQGYAVDIVGCGGALDGASYRQLIDSGASAVQYWSALIYRGPLAAAVILHEAGVKK